MDRDDLPPSSFASRAWSEDDAEWLNRMIPGSDPQKQVNVLVRWSKDPPGCEIAVADENVSPNMEEWHQWAAGKDLYVRILGVDEDGRQWMRFEGPGAKELFDTIAVQATEMAAAEDYEVGRATLGGALLSNSVGRPINYDAIVEADGSKAQVPPEWEGSPSFRQVWESTDWMHHNYKRDFVISSMDVVNADCKVGMANAHPIVIPPQQVAALPILSFREAIEYLSMCHMPFPQVFLDAADSPNARDLMLLGSTNQEIGFVGGLVADLVKDQMRGIVPCGAVVWPTEKWDEGIDGTKPPPGHPGLLSDPGGHGLPSHAPIGTCLIAPFLAEREKGITFNVHEHGPFEPLERLWTVQAKNEGLECLQIGGEVIEEGIENCVLIPAVADLFSFTEHYDLEKATEKLEGWAKAMALEIRTLAAMMMFLDSHNVEIVDQPLTRQVRRQAERKNKPISKTVIIRHRQNKGREYDYDPDAPRTVGLDHQYEVIGHTRHFTKGSHVRCKACKGEKEIDGPLLPDGSQEKKPCEKCQGTGLDPEHVTPCARRDEKTGLLTCPDGCRKEWVPTFVKGNPDAPLVVKARRQM